MPKETFAIGTHCPVYLWAGPGTVRMNRLKFMDAPVDEAVHAEAHTHVGALRMAEAGFNWAYLMHNWGFPPETEQEDWADFCKAVKVYQAKSIRVFGYVQISNYVYYGSFREKDWYAHDPKGRPFYYYTGRYMTCWRHPEWLDHLQNIVRGIVEAGADGVFFDNPWHGCQPLDFGGTWMGPAGCYCPRCRTAFRETTGLEIPESISPASDETSRRYLRWRAEHVTETLTLLADHARALNPDVFISTNDFDAVMRPSYLVYGIDLRALSQVQDVIMIEDYGLPRWEDGLLVNDALTIRTARALIGDTPLSVDPYDKGIGFDPVYPARRFQQGIAEAAACGASMVVKGTEFVEDGEFTLLTAEKFAPQREAIGHMHRWLAEHSDLYRDRENIAPVGLLYPGDALWQDWNRLAPIYFGVGQALLAAGIPWRVVTSDDDLTGLDALFCFGNGLGANQSPKVISVLDTPDWELPKPSFLARHGNIRMVTAKVVGWLFQGYFKWRWMRSLADSLGLVHFFWQTPYFRLPSAQASEALLQALGEKPYPRVVAKAPVLVEVCRKGEIQQLHLVNYVAEPQSVTVDFGGPVQGHALSPDRPEKHSATAKFQSTVHKFVLDVYTVLEYTEA